MSSLPLSVSADSTHTQTVTIVKYGLSPGATGFASSQTTNDGLEINNLPVDNLGHELSPMANISYQVQPVTKIAGVTFDVKNPATYSLTGSAKTITTNQSGEAILDLLDGTYIIKEEANPSAGLSHPAPPVAIDLPVLNAAGTDVLSNVYIYPKSSVDPEEVTPPSSKPEPSKPSPSRPETQTPNPAPTKPPTIIDEINKALPDTGEAASGILVFLGGLILFFVIFLVKRRRKEDEEVTDEQK